MEIIDVRAEINKIKNRKITEKNPKGIFLTKSIKLVSLLQEWPKKGHKLPIGGIKKEISFLTLQTFKKILKDHKRIL